MDLGIIQRKLAVFLNKQQDTELFPDGSGSKRNAHNIYTSVSRDNLDAVLPVIIYVHDASE